MLARYPAEMYRSGSEGSDADRTIARIWHVTLDRLASDPLAGDVLRVVAWYASESIPRDLLDGLAEPPALFRAIGRLAAYSMITADPAVLSVHRLVQAVARTPEPGDRHRNPEVISRARDQAAEQLAAALPDWDDPQTWPRWRMLLPHIDALTDYVHPRTDNEAIASILDLTGSFRVLQGQVTRATADLQRSLAARQQILGGDHPHTLTSRNNLASAYKEAGNLGQAISLFRQIVADSGRILGDDDPSTLAFLDNLANAYQEAGNLELAIPLHERTLAAGSVSWGRTTLTPWARVTTSLLRTARRGIWAGPSRCMSRPSPTCGVSWEMTTPGL